MIVLRPHGGDTRHVTEALARAVPACFDVAQVWTWRGGEALIVRSWRASYGHAEYRAVVRMGGLKKGGIRVLCVESIAAALHALGLTYRHYTGARPRMPVDPGSREDLRARIGRAARARGKHFRTRGWRRPARALLSAVQGLQAGLRGSGVGGIGA